MEDQKVINLDNENLIFKQAGSGNLWVGELTLIDHRVNIEFFADKEIFEWGIFSEFLTFLKDYKIPTASMIESANTLLECLAKIFWEKDEAVYQFEFSGINYSGKGTDYFRTDYSYELVFDLIEKDGAGINDNYASWIIQMSGNRIIGVKREQV